MSAEWDPPFGSVGEMAAPPAPKPAQPQPVAQFVIEPPPWANLEAHPELLAPPEQPAPRPPAHATMKPYDPPPFGPPAPKLPPLPRIVPPKPDWELEEKLAIARNKRERLEQARRVLADEHALAEEQPTQHPPPRREPS